MNVNGRLIGDGHPSYIIAEIGSNHNGDYALAIRCIEEAKSAGADAAKFQSFKADLVYSKKTVIANSCDSVYDLIKSLELNREWHGKLKAFCDSIGIEFLTTPCDIEAIDDVIQVGVGALKISSFDLTDTKLIAYMGKTPLPLIISTGMATMEEIKESVNAFKKHSTNEFALLQCSSLYPAPAHITNLSAMSVMKETFGCVIGYSDHTLGDNIPVCAVAMGAKIIEKHFTLDTNLKGPDHAFAMEPTAFAEMVRKIREYESAIGHGKKVGPHKEEKENYKLRRSLIARSDIKKGQRISEEDLIIKRPSIGIQPKYFNDIVGKITTRDVEADDGIIWEMVED